MSKLTVITGSMFSGKSGELVRRLKTARVAGKRVCTYRPDIDTRDSVVKSRDGNKIVSGVIPVKSTFVEFVEGLTSLNPDVIGIDEAQFFEAGSPLIDAIFYLQKRGLEFVVAGLSRDFLGRKFGCMPDLLYMADEVVQTFAVCNKCKNYEGSRTVRVSKSTDQILVGSDEYEARCANCYFEEMA